MSDTRELLRPAVEGFEPTPDAFDRVLLRRDRKRRNRRVAAVVVGISVFAAAAVGLARLLASEPTPAIPEPQPAPVRNGTWVVVAAPHLDTDPDAEPWTRGDRPNLFVTGPDGSARLLVGSADDGLSQQCPAFSPDGSLLAYGEGSPEGKTLVVSGFSSTGELQEPTLRIPMPAARSFVGVCPVWSPDGQRLATIAPGRGVLIADLDGTTSLVDLEAYGLREGGDLELEWSPDGSQLAFLVADAQGQQTVWLVRADDGPAHPLASDRDDHATQLEWTTDGRALVLAGDGIGNPPTVTVIDAATEEATDVPLPEVWAGSTLMQMEAAGGDRFVILRADDEQGWLAPELLDLAGHVTPVGDPAYPLVSYFSVSPDGEQLLYATYDGNHGNYAGALMAVPLDGGEVTIYSPWTNGFGDNYTTFAWQPR